MTQNDDWSARVARLVAREIRRYREQQQPKVSVQRLADRTAELGMPIPRSVLANLESGRRETVSVAEAIVLAAALNVSPIELICPTGFDQQTEILPGQMVGTLDAVRWFTGELKLETGGNDVKLRAGTTNEQSSTYLIEYHEELINRLRARQTQLISAHIDVHEAEKLVKEKTAAAEAAGAADGEMPEELQGAVAQLMQDEANARFRAEDLADWRGFIREPLRQTRAEMRRRGMLLPDLPTDLSLDLSEDDA